MRIARYKNTFDKESLQQWTGEVFRIYKVYTTNPITYKLQDNNGKIIEGIFYKEELKQI